MATDHHRMIVRLLTDKPGLIPAQIGHQLRPTGLKTPHAAWAKGKLKTLRSLGWVEGDDDGGYIATDAGRAALAAS